MEPGMWLTARTRTGIRPSRTVAGTLLVAFLLAACASPVFAPGGSSQPASDDPVRPLDRVHQQAQDALVRWADAVRESGGASITFVGALTSQIGDWEAEVGGNNKVALITGQVETMTRLPTDQPGRREVRWLDDGAKVDVNVLSARDALDSLVEGRTECGGCEPLQVTEANLATDLVDTSRGTAEVPVWVYSLQGTSVRVTRVAVDASVTVDPPPWNADDPPVGISIDSATGTGDSRDLEVGFIGAKSSGPCGQDYTAEAVESELAVVVIVTGRPTATPDDSAEVSGCRLVGFTRTALVHLDEPLGERAVLEVQQGLPVPLHPPE
jgi:hypothetical protein